VTRLHYIDVGYACFGLNERDGRIVAAPPIARWTLGRKAEDVWWHYSVTKRAAQYVVIDEDTA
jgi:hypothetical protein